MGHMIFSPNTTGPLHIGRALVLWLAAREAVERGLKLAVRYDDGMAVEIDETKESVKEACLLLGIKIGKEYTASARSAVYQKAIQILLSRGIACREDLSGAIIYEDKPYAPHPAW